VYRFDFSILERYGPYMAEGLWYTALIAFPSILFATALGLLLALVQMFRSAPLRYAAMSFVDLFRTLPVICLLFWVHYVLPILTGLRLSAIQSAVIALSLNGAAFACEAFRGSIQSIPQTQIQASVSLGLSWVQTMRYVILPQAVFASLPPLTNVHITIIKTIPVAVLIAVPEVMYRAQELTVQFFRPLELYTGAAVMYVAFVVAYSWVMRAAERLQKWEPV
jgi:His/Glu/Gln/Arg/opine family amino acid ABC transporter permease subunit